MSWVFLVIVIWGMAVIVINSGDDKFWAREMPAIVAVTITSIVAAALLRMLGL